MILDVPKARLFEAASGDSVILDYERDGSEYRAIFEPDYAPEPPTLTLTQLLAIDGDRGVATHEPKMSDIPYPLRCVLGGAGYSLEGAEWADDELEGDASVDERGVL